MKKFLLFIFVALGFLAPATKAFAGANPTITYASASYVLTTGTAASISPATLTGVTTATGWSTPVVTISPALPGTLTIDPATGIISGTPTATAASVIYTVTISSTKAATTRTGTATITITIVNPPVFSYSGPNIYTTNIAITALSPTITSDGPLSAASINPALPAGLAISTAGVISGTPTAVAAATTYTITATGADGGVGTATVSITVVNPPVFSYAGPDIYTRNLAITPLSPTITSDGPLSAATINPALPAGLTMSASGVISGTPTAATAVATYTITATGADGGVGTATVRISVVLPPAFTYTGPNVYTTNLAITALSPTVTARGPLTAATISPALPAGLSISATGTISGTPTVASASTTYTITGTGSTGGTSTATVVISVVNPPVFSYTTPQVYTTGLTITSLSPAITSGGPLTGATISPALPAGLTMSAAGVISGTPTAVTAATTYTITATGSAGGTGSATVTITTVNPPVFSYSGPNTYSVSTTITALSPTITSDGPFSAASISPALPGGLTISSAGVISGTPTATSASTTYTITATGADGGVGTATVVISVVTVPLPNISYSPSTNNYPVGTTITNLTPTNSGGAVPTAGFGAGTAIAATTFNGPAGMAFDASGNLYVTANNAKTKELTSSLSYVGTFGNRQNTPDGIVFDSSGNAYILDFVTGYVYKYSSTGAILATLQPGGGFGKPYGIAINSSNDMFVGDFSNGTVTEFNTSGTVLGTFVANVFKPVGIAVDASGNVYVLNDGTATANKSVTVFNSNGVYQSTLVSGLTTPSAIAVDNDGNVYVGDSGTGTVTEYNSSGTVLTTISGLTNPAGLLVDSKGNLYVSDNTNNTVTVYPPAGGYYLSGTLPPGISFNSTTGTFSGTPSSTFPSTTYTVTCYNSGGSNSTTVTISCTITPLVFSYSPAVNTYPINQPITALAPTVTSGTVSSLSYSAGTSITGGTLDGPAGLAIDPTTGNIYAVNYTNNTVLEYSSTGTYITSITLPAGSDAVAFDSSGDAFVISTAGSVYKYTGGFSGTQSTFLTGLSDTGTGILGITVDASNNVYVTSAKGATNSRVFEYAGAPSTAGTALLTLSTNLDNPSGVAVDASGNIYVSNYANGKIYEYNSAGTTSTQLVSSTTITNPFGVAISATGLLYVAAKGSNAIDVINPVTNTLVTSFSINTPGGVVVDSNGDVFADDYTDYTLLEFTPYSGYYLSGTLPAGISFNNTNGTFSGTPTAVYPTTTLTVSAYSYGTKATTTVTFTCYISYDWIGAVSTDWNVTGNWESAVVPGSTNTASIGVNYTFNNSPVVSLSGATTVNVGAVILGNKGGKAAGVSVSSGYILAVTGDITKQSDANSTLGYVSYLSGAGSITAVNLNVLANTTAASVYTESITSSVTSLKLSGNVALTSTNSTNAANAAFNLTGGVTSVTGALTSTNAAGGTSTFSVNPTTTATLQLANAMPLSGLSTTGTNVMSIVHPGATIEYSGAAQTVYTDATITGLGTGLSYQNIKFSGTSIKTPAGTSTNKLNIAGDFTNALTLNDATDYVNLATPIVNFNGATQNIYGGNGTGTTFYTVNFSGTGTSTIQSGNAYVASTGVMTMSNSAVLAAGGLLTLNSDVNGTATIAAIPSGCSVTGQVNVQRYLTGGSAPRRGYRLLSSAVSTSATSGVYTINYVKNSCYVTGTTGVSGGFDGGFNPTLYLFRENLVPSNSSFTSGNYRGINNITSYLPGYYMDVDNGPFSIPAGNGFLFFYRGDRTKATFAAETTVSYVPTSTTVTETGYLNQGAINVNSWYNTNGTGLIYTTVSGTTTVEGFNLVGNPYPSSIDWDKYSTTTSTAGIYAPHAGPFIYILNSRSGNYNVYQSGSGGVGTVAATGSNVIPGGQGFFVVVNQNNATFTFNETGKTNAQATAAQGNLFMGAPIAAAVPQYLHLTLVQDTVHFDGSIISFNSSASQNYVSGEDAPYRKGNGPVSISSYSGDNIKLAINKQPLPNQVQKNIPLSVMVSADGQYNIKLDAIKAIPGLYDIWLKDAFNKDSLDIKNNPTYAFNATLADTTTYSNRFSLVIRQNPALMVHLLNFTANKITGGDQVVWTTENEANYTNFVVQRSTDGGKTFNLLDGVASDAQGTYSYLDKVPVNGANSYRLQITDLNGTISYSNVVTIMYANTNNQIATNGMIVYPNPTKGTVNVAINSNQAITTSGTTNTQSAYNIQIVNNLGIVIKTASSSSANWQTDVTALIPGTYFIQVTDSNSRKVVGKTAFVKL